MKANLAGSARTAHLSTARDKVVTLSFSLLIIQQKNLNSTFCSRRFDLTEIALISVLSVNSTKNAYLTVA